MPPNSAIPITLRASLPEPLATINGKTPRIKEKAVMRIGLNLSLAASIAESNKLNPDSNF